MYKFRRAVKARAQESINSLLGHAKATDTIKYFLTILRKENDNGANIKIPKDYRPIYNLCAG